MYDVYVNMIASAQNPFFFFVKSFETSMLFVTLFFILTNLLNPVTGKKKQKKRIYTM